MNTLAKISDLKVFGISPLRVYSDCAGQPLLEVPLNHCTLNIIGTTFQSDDLGKLGQLCGNVLKRLCADTAMRREVLQRGKDFARLVKSAPRYSDLKSSLVILVHSQCTGVEADEASILITTYFTQLEICTELTRD
jgi:hypothetical protein